MISREVTKPFVLLVVMFVVVFLLLSFVLFFVLFVVLAVVVVPVSLVHFIDNNMRDFSQLFISDQPFDWRTRVFFVFLDCWVFEFYFL